MARPTGSPPTWADDPNYTNSTGKPWQGTPTRVEPSSGDKAQGITPGRKVVAQWVNWILGRLADWIAYVVGFFASDDELQYPTEKIRKITIPLHDMLRLEETAWSYPATEASDYLLLSGSSGEHKAIFPLNRYLRHGHRFVAVTIIAKPGSDPGVGDRMRVGLYLSLIHI
jgi:hypothetical protein